MVAGIDIAVVLHDCGMSTLFGIDADAGLCAHPACEGGIKELYKDLAHIMAHPFVEDGTHKMSPFFGTDTEGGYGTVFIEKLCQVSAIAMLLDALYDGTYLEELTMQFIAKEVVKGKGVLRIMMVGCRHCVPFHAIVVQELDAVHHLLPCSPTLNIESVGIVLLLGAVDADAYEPSFVVEELAPLWGEQGAVCLYAVADALASSIIALQPDCLFVEAEGPEHGLASVPGEEYIGHLLHLDIVADVLLPDPL